MVVDAALERAVVIIGRSGLIPQQMDCFLSLRKQAFFVIRQGTGKRQHVGHMVAAKDTGGLHVEMSHQLFEFDNELER